MDNINSVGLSGDVVLATDEIGVLTDNDKIQIHN